MYLCASICKLSSVYSLTPSLSDPCLQVSVSSSLSLSLHIFISLPSSLFSHPASVQLHWTLLCERGGLRASLKVHLSMDPPHTVTLRISQQHTCPVLLPRVPQGFRAAPGCQNAGFLLRTHGFLQAQVAALTRTVVPFSAQLALVLIFTS